MTADGMLIERLSTTRLDAAAHDHGTGKVKFNAPPSGVLLPVKNL